VIDRNPALKDSDLAKHVKDGKMGPEDVKALQQELQAKGFDVGTTGVDGKYGPKTHDALQKYLGGGQPDPAVSAKTHEHDHDDDVDDENPHAHDPAIATPTGPESDQEYNVGGPQPAVKRQGKYIGKSIAKDFDRMVEAAKKDGVDLRINSGMRTRAEQQALYDKYHGKRPVALPGHSNHEKGEAIDFANTPGAYAWLKRNSAKFGLHNLPSEPWHYSRTGR
jgi:hypothetical protein